MEGDSDVLPLLNTSKMEPLVVPVPVVPKLELAPVDGALLVELKEELGGGGGAAGAEPPDVLSACPSAASGHESAINVAILSRLEIMKVV